MIRAFFTIILPLLLPTILYFLWILAMRRAQAAGAAQILQQMPWPWLAVAGIVLAGAVVVLVAMRMGSEGSGEYVPPHIDAIWTASRGMRRGGKFGGTKPRKNGPATTCRTSRPIPSRRITWARSS